MTTNLIGTSESFKNAVLSVIQQGANRTNFHLERKGSDYFLTSNGDDLEHGILLRPSGYPSFSFLVWVAEQQTPGDIDEIIAFVKDAIANIEKLGFPLWPTLLQHPI